VKGDNLCRIHRYANKKKTNPINNIVNEIPKLQQESEDVDAESLVSIQEDQETYQSDDTMELTQQFVWKCIDSYFEEHKKRSELISDFKSDKKKGKGSFNMETMLGIGAVSLLPLLHKLISNFGDKMESYQQPNIANACSNQESTATMEPKRKPASPIQRACTEESANVSQAQGATLWEAPTCPTSANVFPTTN
jgi:hypothetical protein